MFLIMKNTGCFIMSENGTYFYFYLLDYFPEMGMLLLLLFLKSPLEDMFVDLRERERLIWETLTGCLSSGDGTHNLSMCADPGLNSKYLGVQDDTPTNQATQTGQEYFLKIVLEYFLRSFIGQHFYLTVLKMIIFQNIWVPSILNRNVVPLIFNSSW